MTSTRPSPPPRPAATSTWAPSRSGSARSPSALWSANGPRWRTTSTTATLLRKTGLQAPNRHSRQLEAADSSETRRASSPSGGPTWHVTSGSSSSSAEEREDQLAALQRRATGSGDLRLVALARVHIGAEEDE